MQLKNSFPYTEITDLKNFKGILDLPKPPVILYSSATANKALFSKCVAVVGSRKMTNYGRQVIDSIVPQLVSEGKTIVSGFMYGVDQYAHKVCIEHGGKTIAVLGWGIDVPLQGNDKKLATEIIQSGGILISEWLDQKPTLWTFPARNRLIVALSQEVIIIEATLKSGSMITAKLAEKLKRTLWAIPGPITSKTSEGTNLLIAQGKAKMWTTIQTKLPKNSSHPLLKYLEHDGLTADELARKTNTSVSKIGVELTILALSGDVIERDGKYYVQ